MDHRNTLYLSGSDDDLEDKLARAERVINFLFLHIIISNQHFYPLAHINTAAPEIEILYAAIHELAERKKIRIKDLNSEKEVKEIVIAEYENNQNKFKHININHLNKISYALTKNQERRDFIGALLNAYIESKGLKSPGVQTLYKIYNQMQKYLNRVKLTQ